MSDAIKQPVLILSIDPSLFDAKSDTVARMREYTNLYESVHVVVCTKGRKTSRFEIAPLVHVHPARYWLRPLGFFQALYQTWRVASQIRPASIIAQDASMFGAMALVVGKLKNIPVVVGIYGTDAYNAFIRRESIKHWFYSVMAKVILRFADVIQTDGPETVERLRQRFGTKVFFKPMFAGNSDALRTIVRHVPKQIFRILFVGRFVSQKNIPLLLEVITETKRLMGNSVCFTLVGDGPEKKDFMRKITDRGLSDIVTDAGVLARDEILDAYSTHHILLITSRYEGFPRVFMEAALVGMPIVTTDVGGVAGLIENGVSGYVLPQGSTGGDFVKVFQGLVHNEPLYTKLSAGIKERWEKLYGGKTVLDYQRPLVEFLTRPRRPKMLILTQKVDKNDGNLGFFHRWIEEFAKQSESVTVICLYEGVHHLPVNVRVLSLGKESGVSRMKYLRRFYSYIWNERKNYDSVFVHMNQIYAILGGLLWRLLGKRIGLWYTHGSVSVSLRVAAFFVHDVFTSTAESFRIGTRKKHIVGHGIDTSVFLPTVTPPSRDGLHCITFGRMSPVKEYETIIDALNILIKKGIAIDLIIIGSAGTPAQTVYQKKLHERVTRVDLSRYVSFVDAVPQQEMLPYLHRAHVFVSASATGSLDKAPLEAMAAGLPVITCNEGMVGIANRCSAITMFAPHDVQGLADALERFNTFSHETLTAMSADVQRVAQEYAVDTLVARIVDILRATA